MIGLLFPSFFILINSITFKGNVNDISMMLVVLIKESTMRLNDKIQNLPITTTIEVERPYRRHDHSLINPILRIFRNRSDHTIKRKCNYIDIGLILRVLFQATNGNLRNIMRIFSNFQRSRLLHQKGGLISLSIRYIIYSEDFTVDRHNARIISHINIMFLIDLLIFLRVMIFIHLRTLRITNQEITSRNTQLKNFFLRLRIYFMFSSISEELFINKS